jgi:hypothetical protein
MSDIRQAMQSMSEPDKSIIIILLEFYETMKGLENEQERGGKQATKIVMTVNDIKDVFEPQ